MPAVSTKQLQASFLVPPLPHPPQYVPGWQIPAQAPVGAPPAPPEPVPPAPPCRRAARAGHATGSGRAGAAARAATASVSGCSRATGRATHAAGITRCGGGAAGREQEDRNESARRPRHEHPHLVSHWTPAVVQNWPTVFPDEPIWHSGNVGSAHMLLSVHLVVHAANMAR